MAGQRGPRDKPGGMAGQGGRGAQRKANRPADAARRPKREGGMAGEAKRRDEDRRPGGMRGEGDPHNANRTPHDRT